MKTPAFSDLIFCIFSCRDIFYVKKHSNLDSHATDVTRKSFSFPVKVGISEVSSKIQVYAIIRNADYLNIKNKVILHQ